MITVWDILGKDMGEATGVSIGIEAIVVIAFILGIVGAILLLCYLGYEICQSIKRYVNDKIETKIYEHQEDCKSFKEKKD